METVLKEDPEIIIFPSERPKGFHSVSNNNGCDDLVVGGQAGRLHQISADVLNRPGPRIVEGWKHGSDHPP